MRRKEVVTTEAGAWHSTGKETKSMRSCRNRIVPRYLPIRPEARDLWLRLLCVMEATVMPDNTARFETDAVGTTPKGWTGTRTGRGDLRWTVEHDQTAPSR